MDDFEKAIAAWNRRDPAVIVSDAANEAPDSCVLANELSVARSDLTAANAEIERLKACETELAAIATRRTLEAQAMEDEFRAGEAEIERLKVLLAEPERCPTCGSPHPELDLEDAICRDPWHGRSPDPLPALAALFSGLMRGVPWVQAAVAAGLVEEPEYGLLVIRPTALGRRVLAGVGDGR